MESSTIALVTVSSLVGTYILYKCCSKKTDKPKIPDQTSLQIDVRGNVGEFYTLVKYSPDTDPDRVNSLRILGRTCVQAVPTVAVTPSVISTVTSTSSFDPTDSTTIITTNNTNVTTNLAVAPTVTGVKNVFVYHFNTFDKDESNVVSKTIAMKTPFTLLCKFVNLMMNIANSDDEVMIVITCPGGTALYYMDAYSQLCRLKSKGVKMTALVDKVCASGGYLMACACDKIVCANTATIGSIGVYCDAFNIKNVATKIGIDTYRFKSSGIKGGFPVLTDCTEEDKTHQNTKVEEMHRTFKQMVLDNRPSIPKEFHDEIFSGDIWQGKKVIEYGLIDEIAVPDDIIMKRSKTDNVYFVQKKIVVEKPDFMQSIIKSVFPSQVTPDSIVGFIDEIKTAFVDRYSVDDGHSIVNIKAQM